jgi:hypothetical protein
MKHPASELTAQQLAAFYRDFATVQDYVAGSAEHITLAGPFACKQRAPRSAPKDRFAAWRLRLRTAHLSRLYNTLPLLRGYPT